MDHFAYQNGALHAEDVALADIAAAVGTPCYVYSSGTLRRHAQVFAAGLAAVPSKHIAFAVKSNPNLAVLRLLASEGYGADVVSAGEMDRALAAGIPGKDIVFSGVGKTADELTRALKAGVGQFNLESEEEGVELAGIAAALGLTAQAALRVNPDVDAKTHAKISTGMAENKFGVSYDRAAGIYARLSALPGLSMRGLAVHIGSQLSQLQPLEDAFTKMGDLMRTIRANGQTITHMDLGGGVGVPYKDGDVFPTPAEYGAMVARVTADWGVTLMFEPGRVIAGNSGVLITQVVRVKEGVTAPFVIVDAAMNDLARPALYGAWHDFWAVTPRANALPPTSSGLSAKVRTLSPWGARSMW
jgi:diaminopimelate decarboxylase